MKTYIVHADYQPINYILKNVVLPDVEIICLKKTKSNPLFSALRQLCTYTGLYHFFPGMYFDEKSYSQLKAIATSETPARLIVIDAKRNVILHLIAQLGARCSQRILFFWTPINQIYKKLSPSRLRHRLKGLEKEYLLRSFNQADSISYSGIQVLKPFFCQPLHTGNIKEERGIYFIGEEKGRTQILNSCKETFERQNIPCHLLILGKTEKHLSYEENLENVQKYSCILDITLNQTGLSLRPLEALFFKKKLITNNPEIKKYDFYHPQNIFIWGEDQPERLNDFLSQPFHEIPDTLRKQYDINYWIQQFS